MKKKINLMVKHGIAVFSFVLTTLTSIPLATAGEPINKEFYIRVFNCKNPSVVTNDRDIPTHFEVFQLFTFNKVPEFVDDGMIVLGILARQDNGAPIPENGLMKGGTMSKIEYEYGKGFQTYEIGFNFDAPAHLSVTFQENAGGTPQPAKAKLKLRSGLEVEYDAFPSLGK